MAITPGYCVGTPFLRQRLQKDAVAFNLSLCGAFWMIPFSQALKVMSASCGPLEGFFANLAFHRGTSPVAAVHSPGSVVHESPSSASFLRTPPEQECQFVEILLFDPKTTYYSYENYLVRLSLAA